MNSNTHLNISIHSTQCKAGNWRLALFVKPHYTLFVLLNLQFVYCITLRCDVSSLYIYPFPRSFASSFCAGACMIRGSVHLLWHGNLWWDWEGWEGSNNFRLCCRHYIKITGDIKMTMPIWVILSRWQWRLNWASLEAQWAFLLASPSSVGSRSSTTYSGLFFFFWAELTNSYLRFFMSLKVLRAAVVSTVNKRFENHLTRKN